MSYKPGTTLGLILGVPLVCLGGIGLFAFLYALAEIVIWLS